MKQRKIYNWHDVTVEQYLEITEILTQKMSPTEFILEVGDIFFEVDEDVTESELKEIKQSISFVRTPIISSINTDEIKPFNKFSMSEFIDLDVILVTHTFTDCIPKIIPMIYEGVEDVMNAKITKYYKGVEEVVKYRNDVFKKYPNLFGDEDDEDEEDDEIEAPKKPAAQMWLETIHTICEGNLTRYREVMALPHLLVLNWFSLSQANKPRLPKKIV